MAAACATRSAVVIGACPCSVWVAGWPAIAMRTFVNPYRVLVGLRDVVAELRDDDQAAARDPRSAPVDTLVAASANAGEAANPVNRVERKLPLQHCRRRGRYPHRGRHRDVYHRSAHASRPALRISQSWMTVVIASASTVRARPAHRRSRACRRAPARPSIHWCPPATARPRRQRSGASM